MFILYLADLKQIKHRVQFDTSADDTSVMIQSYEEDDQNMRI